MKLKVTLTETEKVVVRRSKRSIVIDTETSPIFKGVNSVHQAQDIIYYEYLRPEVQEFTEMLYNQEVELEEDETDNDGECPEIEVEAIDDE